MGITQWRNRLRDVIRPKRAVKVLMAQWFCKRCDLVQVIERAYGAYRWKKHIGAILNIRSNVLLVQAIVRGKSGRNKVSLCHDWCDS